LEELWKIARTADSDSARVAALRVLLQHEQPDAAGAVDTDALLRQLAGDPSVAGSARLRALERVRADEEEERKRAQADDLHGAELTREFDATLTALIIVQRTGPPEARLPRLHAEVHAWARDLAHDALRAPETPPGSREPSDA
jgi:hypothetical protein